MVLIRVRAVSGDRLDGVDKRLAYAWQWQVRGGCGAFLKSPSSLRRRGGRSTCCNRWGEGV